MHKKEYSTVKIITLMGRKGGITKTTLAANLAAGCVRAGARTLLVSADGQANLDDITCSAAIIKDGVIRFKQFQGAPGMYRLLLEDADFSDVLISVPARYAGIDGHFFLLPTDDGGNRKLEQNSKTPSLIYQRFGELEGHFDVVIVDTSPAITEIHAGFYYTSDYVLLPTTLEYASIASLGSTLTYLATAAKEGRAAGYPVAQVLGIVPNCYRTSEGIQRENKGFLVGRYAERFTVFEAIRDLTAWNQANQNRQSVYAYLPEGDYSGQRRAKTAANELRPVLDAVLGVIEGAKV